MTFSHAPFTTNEQLSLWWRMTQLTILDPRAARAVGALADHINEQRVPSVPGHVRRRLSELQSVFDEIAVRYRRQQRLTPRAPKKGGR